MHFISLCPSSLRYYLIHPTAAAAGGSDRNAMCVRRGADLGEAMRLARGSVNL